MFKKRLKFLKLEKYGKPLDILLKTIYNFFVAEVICHVWCETVERVRLAQLDRAFGYGPKGRGFESSNARTYVHICTVDRNRKFVFDEVPVFLMSLLTNCSYRI